MAKKALLIGINYPNTQYSLPGCVNDARAMDTLLHQHFGFATRKILLDGNATLENILRGMLWLTSNSQPGDVLYLHFSGHGSRIGPCSFIWPADDIKRNTDATDVLENVRDGVHFTVFFDCCDHEYLKDTMIQVNDLTKAVFIHSCLHMSYANDIWMHDKYMGAGTYFLIENLRNNNWTIDYSKLVVSINRDLKIHKFDQRLRLSGNTKLFGDNFLQNP